MSAHYLGSRTLGECLPSALTAVAALDASVAIALPEINAKLAGLLQIQAALTIQFPSISIALAAALEVAAELQASITLGLPGATLQLSALIGIIADLEISLGSLSANLSLAAVLNAQLGTAGVHAFSYTGRADGLVPALGGLIPGALPGGFPSDFTGAILLAASAPAPRIAMGTFCGVDLTVT